MPNRHACDQVDVTLGTQRSDGQRYRDGSSLRMCANETGVKRLMNRFMKVGGGDNPIDAVDDSAPTMQDGAQKLLLNLDVEQIRGLELDKLHGCVHCRLRKGN